MNWINLETDSQLDEIRKNSTDRPQVIFKHSTRCSTSAMVKGRLDRAKAPENLDFYYLDLIRYRPVSNKIAEQFHIPHESPQVLVIKDGKCVYNESHTGITMDDIIEESAGNWIG